MNRLYRKCGILAISQKYRHPRPVTWRAFPASTACYRESIPDLHGLLQGEHSHPFLYVTHLPAYIRTAGVLWKLVKKNNIGNTAQKLTEYQSEPMIQNIVSCSKKSKGVQLELLGTKII
jgi:hypothetical protein